MGILSWIVIGLIAGVIAKFLMPGDDPGGIIITILIGIAGGFIGGYIGTLLGLGSVKGLDWQSILLAIAGAFLLLLVLRLFRKKA